jgi:hypothetical protein
VVVDGQRRVEHRLQARQAARPRSISDSTQPAANIGQISWPRYIVKLVSAPMVSWLLPDQVAAQAQRQAAGGGQGQADRRLVGRFPFLRAQAGVGRVAGQFAELLALRCSRPSARKVRTPDRVSCTWSFSAREALQRIGRRGVDMAEMYQNASAISGKGSSAIRPGASRRRAASRPAP